MAVPLQFRLVFLLLCCTICFGEERDIYLVMVEGDPPVAFLQDGSGSLQSGEKLDSDQSSEILKARHAKYLEDFHDQLLQTTLEQGAYKKLYSFNHIVNGFSVHTTPTQANKLKKAPGVKLVEKDRGVKMMTNHSPKLLGLPQGVWRTQRGPRNAGQGIVIGFVDTGINPVHPSFAYNPRVDGNNITRPFPSVCQEGPMFPAMSCNGKIITARFFSAGAEASGNLNASIDILSPYDAVGHGSHVASTAAGNYGVPVIVNGFNYGRASGMAPCARIAVYKAIYPSMGTQADVLAAIDQAIKDGVDILNLSIGPDEPSNKKLTMLSMFDIFMLFARKAGVLVVQAAGNRGPDPYTIASYSPWAIGVGNCNTDRTYPGSLFLGNGQKLNGIGLSTPTSLIPLLQAKLVLAKDAILKTGNFPKTPEFVEECQHPEALDPVIVQKSIVICMFSSGFMNGTSSLPDIMNTAKTLGFAGFVFIANPTYGDFIADSYPFSIPGIMIPKVIDAQIILDYYEKQTQRNNNNNNNVTTFHAHAAIGEGRVASYNVKYPVVSRYSSRGPNFINVQKTPLDLLKPDIIAPGHNIWAAWSPMSVKHPILSGYNFGLVSGTSMAAPHISGIAALIKQRYPSWSPSMIASAMATTATIYDNRGEPIMAQGQGIYSLQPSTHFDHGAGLVRPAQAIDPGLVFMSEFEDYMSFLCSVPNADPEVIKSAIGETCAHSFNEPSDLNTPSLTISALTGTRLVRRTVKSVANELETYMCGVVPPTGVAVAVNPPWFTIAPESTQDLEVILNVTQVQDSFRHGEIVLTGSLKHVVRIPLSIFPVSVS